MLERAASSQRVSVEVSAVASHLEVVMRTALASVTAFCRPGLSDTKMSGTKCHVMEQTAVNDFFATCLELSNAAAAGVKPLLAESIVLNRSHSVDGLF